MRTPLKRHVSPLFLWKWNDLAVLTGGGRMTGNTVFLGGPAPKVDLATFLRAEGTKGVPLPGNPLTAARAADSPVFFLAVG